MPFRLIFHTKTSYLCYFIVLGCLLAYCTSKTAKKVFQVEHEGALVDIMKKGDLSAHADLREYSNTDHLYALGALENLKGEILILDGRPIIAQGSAMSFNLDHSFEYEAALFVHSIVNEWSSHPIPDTVITYKELENYLPQIAYAQGIDTSHAFPFMLEGMPKEFYFHVVNWPEGDTDHTHEKHIRSGPNGRITHQEVEILGFYSNKNHGTFTHHGSNMHLHVYAPNLKIAGHLDDLELGEGMKVNLPIE